MYYSCVTVIYKYLKYKGKTRIIGQFEHLGYFSQKWLTPNIYISHNQSNELMMLPYDI